MIVMRGEFCLGRCKSRSSRTTAIDALLQKGDHTVEISLEEYKESYRGVDLREREDS